MSLGSIGFKKRGIILSFALVLVSLGIIVFQNYTGSGGLPSGPSLDPDTYLNDPAIRTELDKVRDLLTVSKLRDVHVNAVISWPSTAVQPGTASVSCDSGDMDSALRTFKVTGKFTCGAITWKLGSETMNKLLPGNVAELSAETVSQFGALIIPYLRKYDDAYRLLKSTTRYSPGSLGTGRLIVPLTMKHIIYVLPHNGNVIIQDKCRGEFYCKDLDLKGMVDHYLRSQGQFTDAERAQLIEAAKLDFFSDTFPMLVKDDAIAIELLHELGHVFMPVAATSLFWDDSQMEGWADLAGPLNYILNSQLSGENRKFYSESFCLQKKLETAVNITRNDPVLSDPNYYVNKVKSDPVLRCYFVDPLCYLNKRRSGMTDEQIQKEKEQRQQVIADEIKQEAFVRIKSNIMQALGMDVVCQTYFRTVAEFWTSSLTDAFFTDYLAKDEDFDSLYSIPGSKQIKYSDRAIGYLIGYAFFRPLFAYTELMHLISQGPMKLNEVTPYAPGGDLSTHTWEDLGRFYMKLPERSAKGFLGPISGIYQHYIQKFGPAAGMQNFYTVVFHKLLGTFSNFSFREYCGDACNHLAQNRETFFGLINSDETDYKSLSRDIAKLNGVPIPIWINNKFIEPFTDTDRYYRANFFQYILSSATGQDLSHYFQNWNWPLMKTTKMMIYKSLIGDRDAENSFAKIAAADLPKAVFQKADRLGVPKIKRLTIRGGSTIEWESSPGSGNNSVARVSIFSADKPEGPFVRLDSSSANGAKGTFGNSKNDVTKPYYYELAAENASWQELPLSKQIEVRPIKSGECDRDAEAFRQSGVIRCGNVMWDLSPITASKISDPITYFKLYDSFYSALIRFLNEPQQLHAQPTYDVTIIREIREDGKRANPKRAEVLDGHVISIKTSDVLTHLIPAAGSSAIPDQIAQSIAKVFIESLPMTHKGEKQVYLFQGIASDDDWAYVLGVLSMLIRNETGGGPKLLFYKNAGTILENVLDLRPFYQNEPTSFIRDIAELYLSQAKNGKGATFYQAFADTMRYYFMYADARILASNTNFGNYHLRANIFVFVLSKKLGTNLTGYFMEQGWKISFVTSEIFENGYDLHTWTTHLTPQTLNFSNLPTPILIDVIFRKSTNENEISWNWKTGISESFMQDTWNTQFSSISIYRGEVGKSRLEKVGTVINNNKCQFPWEEWPEKSPGEYCAKDEKIGKFVHKLASRESYNNYYYAIVGHYVRHQQTSALSKPRIATQSEVIRDILMEPYYDAQAGIYPTMTWKHPLQHPGYSHTAIYRLDQPDPEIKKKIEAGKIEPIVTVGRDQESIYVDKYLIFPDQVYYYYFVPRGTGRTGDPVVYRAYIMPSTSFGASTVGRRQFHPTTQLPPDLKRAPKIGTGDFPLSFGVRDVPFKRAFVYLAPRQKLTFIWNVWMSIADTFNYTCRASGDWGGLKDPFNNRGVAQAIVENPLTYFSSDNGAWKKEIDIWSSEAVFPRRSGIYTLTCHNSEGTMYSSESVGVIVDNDLPWVRLNVDVLPNDPEPHIKLLWDVRFATKCVASTGTESGYYISGMPKISGIPHWSGRKSIELRQSEIIRGPTNIESLPNLFHTYNLVCENQSGSTTQSVQVDWVKTNGLKKPQINFFGIVKDGEFPIGTVRKYLHNSYTVAPEEEVELRWIATAADSCRAYTRLYWCDGQASPYTCFLQKGALNRPPEYAEWESEDLPKNGSMTLRPKLSADYYVECFKSVPGSDQKIPVLNSPTYITITVDPNLVGGLKSYGGTDLLPEIKTKSDPRLDSDTYNPFDSSKLEEERPFIFAPPPPDSNPEPVPLPPGAPSSGPEVPGSKATNPGGGQAVPGQGPTPPGAAPPPGSPGSEAPAASTPGAGTSVAPASQPPQGTSGQNVNAGPTNNGAGMGQNSGMSR